MKYLIPCWLLTGLLYAQRVDLSSLDKLGDKATESHMVTLDSDKLQLAGDFVAGDENAKKLFGSLKGVFVRSFEFEKPGVFSKDDVEGIRKQMNAPGWSRIVNIRERGESTEIWFFGKGSVGGMTIIVEEPKELTVVNIVGPVDLASLGKLAQAIRFSSTKGGVLDNLTPGGASTPSKKKEKDDDDDEDDN